MLDFFTKIGEILTNIFEFFQSTIDGVNDFVANIQAWWDTAIVVLSFLPDSLVAFLIAGFLLLLAFIVIELLRDFL